MAISPASESEAGIEAIGNLKSQSSPYLIHDILESVSGIGKRVAKAHPHTEPESP